MHFHLYGFPSCRQCFTCHTSYSIPHTLRFTFRVSCCVSRASLSFFPLFLRVRKEANRVWRQGVVEGLLETVKVVNRRLRRLMFAPPATRRPPTVASHDGMKRPWWDGCGGVGGRGDDDDDGDGGGSCRQVQHVFSWIFLSTALRPINNHHLDNVLSPTPFSNIDSAIWSHTYYPQTS